MSFPNTNKYYGSQKGLPIFLFCPLHFSLQCGKIEICRYSIAVITSVSQTEEAGSTPVICSRRGAPAGWFAFRLMRNAIFSAHDIFLNLITTQYACAPDHVAARKLAHFYRKTLLYIAYSTIVRFVQIAAGSPAALFAFRLMRNAIFSAHDIISKPHHDTVRLRSRPRCRSQARSLLPEDIAVHRLQHYCPFRADSSGEPRCLVRVSLNAERDFFRA